MRGSNTRAGFPPIHVYPAMIATVLVAAYAGDVGRGFIKEDATWVVVSRVRTLEDVWNAFTYTGGLFRPTVALSFALNYPMFGGSPSGYGWTNFVLTVACAVAIGRFVRAVGLSTGAALLAGSLWVLNFHGINMAILWISGRTALLLTLFSVLAATAAAHNRLVAASIYTFFAMTSKEEGVFVPFLLLAVMWLGRNAPVTRPRLAKLAVVMVVLSVVYGGLRLRSDAYLPTSAPAFYTFMAPGWSLSKNIAEYADRALTLTVIVTVVALIVGRRRPRLDAAEWKLLALGGIWFVAGFALTILLPTRSSLYVLFPSVGAVLGGATLVEAAWPDILLRRQRGLLMAGLLIPLLFIPIYRQRNARWTELADISRRLVNVLSPGAAQAPSPWQVVVVDDRATRANVAAAIGAAVPDAVELATGKRPQVWLVPPPSDLEPHEYGITPDRPHSVVGLQGGQIVQFPPTSIAPVEAFKMR